MRQGNVSSNFICDLHVIEDLPCDIILSNKFIFQNQVFSRFGSLFCSRQPCIFPQDVSPDGLFLYVRNKSLKESWWRRWRRGPWQSQSERDGIEPPQGGRHGRNVGTSKSEEEIGHSCVFWHCQNPRVLLTRKKRTTETS